jgi:hypothetical protein
LIFILVLWPDAYFRLAAAQNTAGVAVVDGEAPRELERLPKEAVQRRNAAYIAAACPNITAGFQSLRSAIALLVCFAFALHKSPNGCVVSGGCSGLRHCSSSVIPRLASIKLSRTQKYTPRKPHGSVLSRRQMASRSCRKEGMKTFPALWKILEWGYVLAARSMRDGRRFRLYLRLTGLTNRTMRPSYADTSSHRNQELSERVRVSSVVGGSGANSSADQHG